MPDNVKDTIKEVLSKKTTNLRTMLDGAKSVEKRLRDISDKYGAKNRNLAEFTFRLAALEKTIVKNMRSVKGEKHIARVIANAKQEYEFLYKAYLSRHTIALKELSKEFDRIKAKIPKDLP